MNDISVTPNRTAKAPPFARSSLLTPDRVTHSPDEAINYSRPDWAIACVMAGPETRADEAKIAVVVGGKHPRPYSFQPLGVAILFELTRYGNSIVPNTNGKGKFYLKITFRDEAKDAMPVSRIIRGAGPHEVVRKPKDFPNDFDVAALSIEGGGKPTKEAREIAMSHAERCARDHVGPEAVAQYLDNLRALFALHDSIHKVQLF